MDKRFYIHEIVSRDDISSLIRLLPLPPHSINQQDDKGRTPLHFAALLGLNHFIDLLMRWKAEINVQDVFGLTPLHLAAFAGQTNSIHKLVSWGANPNVKTGIGHTPIELCISDGKHESARQIRLAVYYNQQFKQWTLGKEYGYDCASKIQTDKSRSQSDDYADSSDHLSNQNPTPTLVNNVQDVQETSLSLDKFFYRIASFGVPGLIFMMLIAISPYAGAAAITWALALLGGPFGMIGGLVTLIVIAPTISEYVAKHGTEKLVKGVVNKLVEKGTSKQEIGRQLQSFPLSSELKSKILKHIEAT